MNKTPEIYCIRANYGQYTDQFLEGGYVAIGWLEKIDLSTVKNRAEIQPLYRNYHEDTSPYVIGQQVGQIARFLLDIVAGDYVIVPAPDTEFIYWGVMEDKPYYFGGTEDGCPFAHRRPVKWNPTPIRRAEFSVPFQNTIRSTLTVFWIKHKQSFFEAIDKKELIPKSEQQEVLSYYESVIRKILELDFKDFELLITEILKAYGFEAQHTGKTGDGGIDVTGDLDIANMAKIKLIVQVKRYDIHNKINDRDVKALRQNIPNGAQGAFITTSDFQKKALDVAIEPGFPRIGTINGNQLVDILVEKWNEIPSDFREKLGLRLGLITE